jgi:hypothetical protein
MIAMQGVRAMMVRRLAPIVIDLLIGAFCHANSAHAQDILALKPDVPVYQIEPPPNYPYAKIDSGRLLLDGRSSGRWFWRDGSSLGWSWQSPVIVSVELPTGTNVEGVTVEANSRTISGFFYPSQIIVYGRVGEALGHLATSSLSSRTDSSSTGERRSFTLTFSARRVDGIMIVVYAHGSSIFLSEISLLSADKGKALNAAFQTRRDAVRDANGRRRLTIEQRPGPRPTGDDMARRFAVPLLSNIKRAESGECGVSRVEPWAEGLSHEVEIPSSTPLFAGAGGRDYAALRIANYRNNPVVVRMRALDHSSHKVRFLSLAHVQALDYSWVRDVAVPVDTVKLPPQSEMIVLAEVEAGVAGRSSVTVAVECEGETARMQIPIEVLEASEPRIHGTIWTYTHRPEHAPVSRAFACDPTFFKTYNVDTHVIHSEALRDSPANRPSALLREYFRIYRDARRVLLSMSAWFWHPRIDQMPVTEAAARLRTWWDWVVEIAAEEEFRGEIVLYPIDEPNSEGAAAILRTREIARIAGIPAKFYSTASTGIVSALSELEIIQINAPQSKPQKSVGGTTEYHSYFTSGDGKLLPLNRYYRLQAWQAFELGLDGVGFWAAWDGAGLSDPASGWTPFVGDRERDFGVIYVSPEGCGLPSRRLLAWSRGIEESRILEFCARKSGRGAVSPHVQAALAGTDAATARIALAQVVAECRK